MVVIRSFDKTNIYFVYHKGTNDNTLVFIHGWSHNHTVWEREIRYFSKRGNSIVGVDLRGHGRSGKPSQLSYYAMEAFAKDINEIIKSLRIKKPIIVGHSFGGMIALKFAELFPRIPIALILIDTNYENPLKDLSILKNLGLTSFTKYLLQHILSHGHIKRKHFREINFSKFRNHSDFFYWIKGAENTPWFCLLAALKGMLEFDESKILHKIVAPTLLIEGEMDHKTPKNVALTLHKRLRNSNLTFIKKATHDTNIRNAKKVNEAIKIFLTSLEGS